MANRFAGVKQYEVLLAAPEAGDLMSNSGLCQDEGSRTDAADATRIVPPLAQPAQKLGRAGGFEPRRVTAAHKDGVETIRQGLDRMRASQAEAGVRHQIPGFRRREENLVLLHAGEPVGHGEDLPGPDEVE